MTILTEEKITNENKTKPSFLLMLLHFWAGICFKVYIEISGLLTFIFGEPGGLNPTSASYYATGISLVTVGAIAFGYFLSIFLVNKVDHVTMSKKVKWVIKVALPIIYFIVAIFLAAITKSAIDSWGNLQIISNATTKEKSIKKSFLKDEVTVIVVKQKKLGFTEEMLDAETLSKLELWTLKMMKSKTRQGIQNAGGDPDKYKIHYDINSSYVERDSKKLAIFKMSVSYGKKYGTNMVRIMGVEKEYLIWVSCIKENLDPVIVWSGACGEKIKDVYGVSFFKGKIAKKSLNSSAASSIQKYESTGRRTAAMEASDKERKGIDLLKVMNNTTKSKSDFTPNEGLEKNPKTYSNVVKIADQVQLPPELVEGNEKQTEGDFKKQKALEWYKLEDESPELFKKLKASRFVSQAHDDIPELTAFEKLFYHVEKYVPHEASLPFVICLFFGIFFILIKVLIWIARIRFILWLRLKPNINRLKNISFEKKCIGIAAIYTIYALYFELTMSILPVIFLLYWIANMNKKKNINN